jgi:hemerythrin
LYSGQDDFSVGITRIDDEHKRLIGLINRLYDGMKASASLLSLETMEFLRDWLGVHILKEDKAYSSFLKAKGMQ